MDYRTEEPRRFRVGVRLPEWATEFASRLFEGLLVYIGFLSLTPVATSCLSYIQKCPES
jgi:hypothetical protein